MIKTIYKIKQKFNVIPAIEENKKIANEFNDNVLILSSEGEQYILDKRYNMPKTSIICSWFHLISMLEKIILLYVKKIITNLIQTNY